jgi:outer membrane lipoprotein-sorting protein
MAATAWNLKPASAFAGLALSAVFAHAVAARTPPSADQILHQAQAKYDTMQSYSSVGKVTSVFRPAGSDPQEAHYSFVIKLARPHLYRVEWQQELPNLVSKGAVWSTGTDDFIMGPGQATPERVQDASTALAMATGLSGGTAATIPAVFFDLDPSPFKHLTDIRVKQDEAIEGDVCYVINGRTTTQLTTTLWISKKSKLLRQQRHDFGGSADSVAAISNDDIKKALEAMNKEPTDDAVASMRAQLESAQLMTKDMTGFSIEIQRHIAVNPPLREADFTPTPTIDTK